MCLTPILSHNSRDTFRATTQGTLASQPQRYHPKLVDHAHPKPATQFLLQHYRLTLLTSRQALHAFRSPNGGLVPPSAKRL